MTRKKPPAAVAPFVERAGARFAVLDSAPDLLIALQEAAPGLLAEVASLGTSGAVVLAGDLATFNPADLLSFLHNGRRDGVLLARSGGAERAVVLIEGNVAWACSSSPAERLGEVACRMGLADRARVHQLLKTQRDAADRRRIGRLLVESGSMTAEDLPRATRHQVIEIFLGLLVAQSGAFLFLVYTYWSQGFPWYLADSGQVGAWPDYAVTAGLLCWAVVVVILVLYLRQLAPEPAEPRIASPLQPGASGR